MMNITRKSSCLIPPSMLIGVLLVLLPIFLFITFDQVEKQKAHIRERLFIRGASLIRTFEAGTRSGMLSMAWGIRKVQNMLLETSFQPDISYIAITDDAGRVLAHSDPDMVGRKLGQIPDSISLNRDAFTFSSREIQRGDTPVFEIFKRFAPHQNRHTHHRRRSHPRIQSGGHPLLFESGVYYIFTGLSMERMNRIQRRLVRRAVGSGVLFFLLGGAGVIGLMFFQAYRVTEADLTRVQAFSDNLVQNMPTGLITVDTTGTIISENRAARKILGGNLQKPFSQMRAMAGEIASSGEVICEEFDLVRTDSPRLRLDMIGSPLLDNDGKMTGFLFLFRDLTKMRLLEQELETTRRLAAIGKLAGGVAHEIRNPLSSIKGFATYFMKRSKHESQDVETAGIMIKEVERINQSITQLLEFATPLAARKEEVMMAGLIEHSLRLAEHDLKERKIAVTVAIEPGLGSFRTDPQHVCQILLNLYKNALYAMEEGGQLTIMAGLDSEEKGLEIRVKDNGSGMDRQTLEHIFDPYFTTRPDGTGLGLSLVHRMIETLGGTIRVVSQPANGTEFVLFFPEDPVDSEVRNDL